LSALAFSCRWLPRISANSGQIVGWRPPADAHTFLSVRTTSFFDAIRIRADRVMITDGWLERASRAPIREEIQADGRIRRWVSIPEWQGRILRVIFLPDGQTVHNAFFDRRFRP
jgi:hypothetical protein